MAYKNKYNKYSRQVYLNFYRQYLSLFEIEGISRQAQEFVLNELWHKKTVACYQVPATGDIIFTPYSQQWFNIYNYPTKCTLINTRGVSFIPTKTLDIYQGDDFKKDVVITMFPGRSELCQSLADIAKYYSEVIGDIIATYDTNLHLQKIPFFIKSDSQSVDELSKMLRDVLEDKMYIGCSADMTMGSIEALTTGAPYLLDKLKHEQDDWSGEFQSILGIKHQNIEKKANLVKHEAEAGDYLTELSGELLRDTLQSFIDDINFNFSTSLKLIYKPNELETVEEEQQPDENEQEKEEDEL